MPIQHGVVHKFAAGLNAGQTPVPLPFDSALQQGWKVYYEGLNDGIVRTDDAYWLVQANGGGTVGAGDSNSIVITGDGTVYSGYSLYKTLADVILATDGKRFYLETRVKLTLDTAGTVPANGWFVGFTSANEAMTTGASDALDGGDEALGFGQVDTDTAISFYSREDATNQAISFDSALADSVYAKLTCYYDGANFNLYRDDYLISTTAMTQLNADEAMTPQVYFEVVEAKANTLNVQYLLLAVEL